MPSLNRVLLCLAAVALPAIAQTSADESRFITRTRQLTFDGLRSGEGYFAADGNALIFQSEREPGNPFYQIYYLNFVTGQTQRVSTGVGKTTCGWIHPAGKLALFASTHEDPAAKSKQEQELADRAAGTQKRYAWDYDEHYDIYSRHLQSGKLKNLTETLGYDAEGSYSPDGKKIVFASNRHAYKGKLSDEDAKKFDVDKSFLMDIYIMDADGDDVERLTDAEGYDGGPFFSPDGKKICWRRFSPDGATAEIFTMNTDGSEQRAITKLGALSWAPFFHSSGKYLVFATNKEGFDNFELYLVDAEGKSDPVRVTATAGFDGLPTFTPNGEQIAWTTNRTAGKKSQIFIGDWNHAAALAAINMDNTGVAIKRKPVPSRTVTPRNGSLAGGDPRVTADDLRLLVEVLTAPTMEGRGTGTEGERLATEYVARVFEELGLEPAGDGGTYFQPFEFTSGVVMGPETSLALHKDSFKLDEQWRPVGFSKSGTTQGPVVFVGYGIVIAKTETTPGQDDYAGLDVKGKWVMVLRGTPETATPERRQLLNRYASLRSKATAARDKGAAGIVFVTGPNSKIPQKIVPLGPEGQLPGSPIAAVSISDDLADAWLNTAGNTLKNVQDKLDAGEPLPAFEIPDAALTATVDIKPKKSTGRNVLARLRADGPTAGDPVMVGAHVDHLGRGRHQGSLGQNVSEDSVHHGADDNASGTAGVLEIAQELSNLKHRGKLALKRDVLFAAWSGEELGLLGSAHYVKKLRESQGKVPISSYLNMDMIGRFNDNLSVQGIGSSPNWLGIVERANAPVGLKITLTYDSFLPTDSTSFFTAGVPVLIAFTGLHTDYHRPTDTAEKLNYFAAESTVRVMANATRELATSDSAPPYVAQARPAQTTSRSEGLRAYLGTIPDYTQDESVKGLKLTGVAKDGPADKSGVKPGDVIVELGGKKINTIYDYTDAIGAMKPGQETTLTVQRNGQNVELKVTPTARE